MNVDEAYILKDDVYTIAQTRNRINRFTGATIGTALFTEIPIWRKKNGIPVVKISCSIKECTPAQAGLMLLILREMWMGNLCFGGGKAVGRGALVGVQAKINFKGKKYVLPDNDDNFIKKGIIYHEGLTIYQIYFCFSIKKRYFWKQAQESIQALGSKAVSQSNKN